MRDFFDAVLQESLPPTFHLDPEATSVFLVEVAGGGLAVNINDRYLELFSGYKANLDARIDLRDKTIGEVITAINAVPGYTVTVLADHGDEPAVRLINLEDDPGRLYVFTNPMWAMVKALCWELDELKASLDQAISNMSTWGAEGRILDFWGGFFGVNRKTGEGDAEYANRIYLHVIMPKTNNRALEAIIKSTMGIGVSVIDLGWQDPSGLLYMNNATTFIYDTDYPIYIPSSVVSEGVTFGVVLPPGMTIADLTVDQLVMLRTLCNDYKEAATRGKIIWTAASCGAYPAHGLGQCCLYLDDI